MKRIRFRCTLESLEKQMGLDRNRVVIGNIAMDANHCVEFTLIAQDDVLPNNEELSMSSLTQVGLALEQPEKFAIKSKGSTMGFGIN